MRLITYHSGEGDLHAGVVLGERVVDLTRVIADLPLPASTAARGVSVPAGGLLHLLYAGAGGLASVRRFLDETSQSTALTWQPLLRDVRLAAPLPRPGKIIGIGRNYAEHAKETGASLSERPRIFAKLPSSVVGPGAIVRARHVTKLDLEAELAVVIGAFAVDVPAADALRYVAGYTALNDVSAREFQFDVTPAQTSFAKSMDGFCPMGPWLVTAEEIRDPQTLEIRSFLNDKLMQQGSTRDMLFPIAVLIEYLSRYMTLEPGDVIATGTPSGSGAFRKPPVWLKAGDRVRIEIDDIGTLEHGIG
ncbi:MAG TPA: fumarylacetoacetate hydrolase family protein [Burkholderiales bacterium]|nr:fumarylacetoacetate hydrolase family protein [Burkholderiales bacterium]